MRVHIGSDHAGYELKEHLREHLGEAGHQVIDHGPEAYDGDDDYPTYCLRTGECVAAEPGSLGIVVGGSGNGEQIAANKVKGVRAALAWNAETAELARLHNDANVVSIGARMHSLQEAAAIVDVFLSTAFTGETRHSRRIDMLTSYEKSGKLPPLPDQG